LYLYFSVENDRLREPALCQLYRHFFVPYNFSLSGVVADVVQLVAALISIHVVSIHNPQCLSYEGVS